MTPEEICRKYQDTDDLAQRPFHLSHDTLETEFYRPWEEPRKFGLSFAQMFWAWSGLLAAVALFIWISFIHFGSITW